MISGVLGLYAAYRVAWMSDDGLINIRTALNFSVGNEPVFNIGERVQGYTSPLWFWTQALVGRLFGDFIVTSIILNLIFASLAFFVLGYRSVSPLRLVSVTVLIILSSTLIDFSTSGLENSLGTVLIVLLFSEIASTSRVPLRTALLASFLVLTRLDYVLLLVPFIPQALQYLRRTKDTLVIFCFLFPLTLWFLFSFIYYGQFLPNTFQAKLNIAIPRTDLVFSGLRYIIVSVEADPVIPLIFAGALIVTLRAKNSSSKLSIASSLIFLTYVVWIGGDFMAGRFLTAPISIWLVVLSTSTSAQESAGFVPPTSTSEQRFCYALVVAALLFGFRPMVADRPTYDSPERFNFEVNGIADEAAFYRSKGSSLIGLIREASDDLVDFSTDQSYVRLAGLVQLQDRWFKYQAPEAGLPRNVLSTCGLLGNLGVSSGPATHIIDTCGLVDPFLASLTFRPNEQDWRIGHFERNVPDGYVDAVQFADSSLMKDPFLQKKLESIWLKSRSR
jgi:arabinofuranosyltransferase